MKISNITVKGDNNIIIRDLNGSAVEINLNNPEELNDYLNIFKSQIDTLKELLSERNDIYLRIQEEINKEKNLCYELTEFLLSKIQSPCISNIKDACFEACLLADSLNHRIVYTPHLIYSILSYRDDLLIKKLIELFDIDQQKMLSIIDKRLSNTIIPEDRINEIEFSSTLVKVFQTADGICQQNSTFYMNFVHIFQSLYEIQIQEGRDILSWTNIDIEILPMILKSYLKNREIKTPEM